MFKPTKQQKTAIDENGSILVTAAAGSGKTAVLVERVIRKLKDRENPTSIDRLLIVTFTNAAAAEMRLRIEKRLNEEIEKNPQDSHLQRQATLLPSAQICTIDSFCINLVRENFEQFSVEPNFKIVQEEELSPLYDKAMRRALDYFYENHWERITSLFTALQSAYGDDVVSDMVLDLFKFSRNLPFPDNWLSNCADMYTKNPLKTVRLYSDKLGYEGNKKLIRAKETLVMAIERAQEDPKLFEKHYTALENLEKQLSDVITLSDNDIASAISMCQNLEIPSITIRTKTEALSLAKTALSAVTKAAEEFLENGGGNEELLLQDILFAAPHIETLVDITKLFSSELSALIKRENVLTFYNTEQMCLELLCEQRDGKLCMSEKAEEITDNFDEILVDEYQDTNDLQDTLFSMLSSYGKKLFSVGDVKQSIYGFRGANPENFVTKKDTYIPLENAEENDHKKIVLSSNFRSRKGICEFVNYFCSLIMSKDLGGVEYNDEEVLNSEAQYPECPLPETEIHFLTAEEESAEQTEAAHIAAYIKNTVNCEKFLRDGEGLRAAKYSDYCILLRSPGSHSDIYMKELEKLGIPARIETKGFLKSREINAVLSLLKVINNPTHDIPLLATLMSGIFGFSADEIADIRLCSRDTSLYAALLVAEEEGNEKAHFALECFREYRRVAVYKTLPQFIMWLYDETGILDTASAMPDGERRRNNLLTLLRLSENYANAGIPAFVAYVEKIGNELRTSSGTAGKDSVSIVSFHHSKGLQYPVCIVAGAFRKFNMMDLWKPMLRDRKLGISLKLADEKEGKIIEGVARAAIQKSYKEALRSEELRAMYVALTRAEERLVVVMTAGKTQKTAEKISEALGTDTEKEFLSSANGFYEWFLYAALLNKDSEAVRNMFEVSLPQHKLCECSAKIKTVFGSDIAKSDEERKAQTKTEIDREEILSRFNYEYPYGFLSNVYAKTSVSEIVATDKTGNDFKSRPAFLSKKGLTPAERGTATHKFMQYADYYAAAKDLETELLRLKDNSFLTNEEAAAIDREALLSFFESELFWRMQKAVDLHRELRFLTEVPTGELFSVDSEEKTVVQGVMDCIIEETDGIVVLDFKTDNVNDSSVLSERYAKQLDIYALAAGKMFGKPVKEKIIYSFALSREIKI